MMNNQTAVSACIVLSLSLSLLSRQGRMMTSLTQKNRPLSSINYGDDDSIMYGITTILSIEKRERASLRAREEVGGAELLVIYLIISLVVYT